MELENFLSCRELIDYFNIIIENESYMCDPVTPLAKLKKCSEKYMLMEIFCMRVQADFCKALEEFEKKVSSDVRFIADKWNKVGSIDDASGGITCVLIDGKVFEKAGVNVSSISGVVSAKMVQQMQAHNSQRKIQQDSKYRAVGISCVIHPANPFVPTFHFNFRLFFVHDEVSGEEVWWFGGGNDLTPYYHFDEDSRHFHATLKSVCDKFDLEFYPKYKKECDKYFYLPHREEHRGIGGIFFDDFNIYSFDKCLSFVKNCALNIFDAYLPIVNKRFQTVYNDKHKEWQLFRRGRYVEFNLVYDRGTKFGLCTPGSRTESFLISLPKNVCWFYCYEPSPNSEEAKLTDIVKTPRDWV